MRFFLRPKLVFPPVRYEIVKVQLWTDGLLLTAWLPSQETENAGACQAGGLMDVCILPDYYITLGECVNRIAMNGSAITMVETSE